MINGIQYLHKKLQIHRDIKCSNTLISEDGLVKLCDFSESAHIRGIHHKRHTFVGSPCWMAPEVMQQDVGYDVKADIWSLGMTAIELAEG